MVNEKRLIDAQPIVKFIMDGLNNPDKMKALGHDAIEILAEIEYAHTVDAVSRGVHDQVRWERDVAIEQLESYGVSFGEKADVAKVVHGRWISSGCGFDCCSECRKVYTDGYFTAMGIKPREQFNYCPNCGAKMDLKGE